MDFTLKRSLHWEGLYFSDVVVEVDIVRGSNNGCVCNDGSRYGNALIEVVVIVVAGDGGTSSTTLLSDHPCSSAASTSPRDTCVSSRHS